MLAVYLCLYFFIILLWYELSDCNKIMMLPFYLKGEGRDKCLDYIRFITIFIFVSVLVSE